jgi:hypothetical protein
MMTKTSNTLVFTPNDGGKSYMYGTFDTREDAEADMRRRREREPKRWKSIKVLERKCTPGGQSTNACMLTIAR